MAIAGAGLAGLGYSLARTSTPAPPAVVFVPHTITPTTQTPAPTPSATSNAAPQAIPQPPATRALPPEPSPPVFEPTPKLEAGKTLNINTATAEQLQLLPGIGPSRAAAIVADRERMGPFRTVEDLARVRGIGTVTIEGLRPYVRIEPP